MMQKTVKIKGKKHFTKAQIHNILANYKFLTFFSAFCLINNDNYFDYDKLVDFIYYCKLNNKYTSLIKKIYIGDSTNSLRKAAEVMEENKLVRILKSINVEDPNKSSLIIYINERIALNTIMNEENYNEMNSFVIDYYKFYYEKLINNTKRLVK